MQREIRFRGKYKYNWVYGSYLHGIGLDGKPLHQIEIVDANNHRVYDVIPESVGQLWIPSLGKECYGGDLFYATCSIERQKESERQLCKVIDGERGFNCAIFYKGEWYAYKSMDFTTMEIIGTIHDNQNLLT